MSNEIKAQASIEIVDGALTTTSLDVARHFEKQHRNVLQAIENLLPKLTDSYKLNFQLIQIEVDLGMGRFRQEPAYRITRDGFTLLGMSFTGDKALKFKLAYIEAFNRMEATLVHQQLTQAEVARIEHDYAENEKHHHFYKLGESLNTAVIMDEYDEATEIDREIDKLDLSVAARAYGIPEDRVRSRIFTHTAAVRYLGRMERGEHMHSNRVLEVVAYASSSAKSREEQKALMHKAVKPKPLPNPTIGDIVAHDLAHKHD